ncbi:MAG: HAD family hydrolase [Phycisphaerales bacterium]|nr:HAD family hydrolase [Phycisphaerales bacterium]
MGKPNEQREVGERASPARVFAAAVSALIFDLDGTLADTLADLTASVNYAMQPFAVPALTASQIRAMVGDGWSILLERASGGVAPQVQARMLDRFREHYSAHYLDRTCIYNGWDETLDGLARRGIQLAVLSNKVDEFTRAIVSRLLGRWTFAAVLGQRDDLPRKPDPAAALLLCRELGRRPDEVLLVGDSGNDVEAAHRAGMKCVGVTWGFRDESHLAAAGADFLIHHPRELLDILTCLTP